MALSDLPTPSTTEDWKSAVSLHAIEEAARRTLPSMAYEFIAAGAADEITVRWNREAFDRLKLAPRVLQDVSRIDLATTLLGTRLPFPILLAPTAYHRAIHPEGEIATCLGAGEAGATWVVSTNTTTPLEEISRVARAPLWFQLYIQSDREFTRELVERAESAGYEAICLTVDTPAIGVRDRQQRSGFRLPEGVTTPHLFDVNSGRRTIATPERVPITWKDVEWLRSVSRMPVVLKGILAADDARTAIAAGAAGLIVSNHGGRNLDTLPASLEALPGVVHEVAGRVPVLMDGGIRRGTDVIKALALGAKAVLIGRPYLYGLGVGGADGVSRVVEILRAELALAMTLCGRRSVEELDSGVLWRASGDLA